MAENFAYEGLDRVLGFIPKATGTLDTTLYAAAITTAGTVDASTPLSGTLVPNPITVWTTDYATSGGGGRGGGGEPAIGTGAYARLSMLNTSVWAGSITTNGSVGRRVTASAAQSFVTSSAAWSNPNVIGNAIVTASTAGAGVAYFYSNFSDNSTVNVNASGIVLQITPFWEFDI